MDMLSSLCNLLGQVRNLLYSLIIKYQIQIEKNEKLGRYLPTIFEIQWL